MGLFSHFKDLLKPERPHNPFSIFKTPIQETLLGPTVTKLLDPLVNPPELAAQQLGISESKTTLVNSLSPRAICYGHGAWQTSLAWRQSHQYGTTNEEPKEALTDVMIIGDHVFGDMTDGAALWVETDRWSIGTDISASGDFWVPADDLQESGDVNEYLQKLQDGQWYVPNYHHPEVAGKRDWARGRNSDNRRVPILQFKLWDGTQTTELRADPWLAQIPGWSDVNRDGRNCGVIALTWAFIVNERVSPGTSSLPFLLECKGKGDIYDWRTASTGYTDNAALCFADALMWEYFPWQRVDSDWDKVRLTPASFHTQAMIDAADLCDETSTAFEGKRYTVSYQISSDADPEQIFSDFSVAMGGMTVTMIDDKIAIIPGGPRNWVAGFDLSDLADAAIITPTRRDRQSRYNTIVAEIRREETEWEYDDTDSVAEAAYLADDQGRIRSRRMPIAAATGKLRGERLAKIALDRHRLEDAATLTVHALMGTDTTGSYGAGLRVREGDIIRLTYPTKDWTDKEFEIVARTWNRVDFSMQLELEEWSSQIDWDGIGGVPDEAREGPQPWKGGLDPVTGLTAAVAAAGSLQIDGKVWVQVEVDWDDHPYVNEVAGSYRVRWQTATMGRWDSGVSDSSYKRMLLRANQEHTIEVRAERSYAAGDWASITFTPEVVELPQPVGDPTIGESIHSNPRFDRQFDGWQDGSSGGATSLIANSYLAAGATNWLLQLDTGDANGEFGDLRFDETVYVEGGRLYQWKIRARSVDIGTAYGTGHFAQLALSYKLSDDTVVRHDGNDPQGPVRQDERLVGTIGDNSATTSRFDPEAHGVWMTVTRAIQCPPEYAIRRVRAFVQAFNTGTEARWRVNEVIAVPINRTLGAQNFWSSVTGGDIDKSDRDDTTYAGLGGFRYYAGEDLNYKSFYNPPGDEVWYLEIRGQARVDGTAVSGPPALAAMHRVLLLLESDAAVANPVDSGTYPYTQRLNLVDTDDDGVVDDWEMTLTSITLASETVGPWTAFGYSVALPKMQLPWIDIADRNLIEDDWQIGSWTPTNATLAAGVTGPDRVTTIAELVETVSSGEHKITLSIASGLSLSTAYIWSFYVRAGELSNVYMRIIESGGDTATLHFDLDTLTFGSVSNLTTYGYDDGYEDGWIRIWVNRTLTDDATPDFVIGLANDADEESYSASSGEGLYVGFVVVEEGTNEPQRIRSARFRIRPSYTTTDADGVVELRHVYHTLWMSNPSGEA